MGKDWRGLGVVVRQRAQLCLDAYVRKCLAPFANHPAEYFNSVIDLPLEYLKVGFAAGYDPKIFLTSREIYERRSPEERKRWVSETHEAVLAACRKPGKNGRPKNIAARQAAAVALYFCEAWHDENAQTAINDYGHRREMRDIAAQAVVEDMFAWMFDDPKYAWRLAPSKNTEQFTNEYGNEIDVLGDIDGWKLKLPPKPPRKK